MTKPIENSIPHAFYEIVKSFEKKQGLNINDIIKVFSEETTKILSKIDPEVVVEYKLDDNSETLSPIIKSMIVISDEEANEYANASENEALLMHTSYISLSDAKAIDKNISLDDVFEKELDLTKLNFALKNTKFQSLLKTIHSSIQQGMSNLRKQKVYETFKNRIGERVHIQFNAKNSDGSWNVQIIDDKNTLTPAYLPSSLISSKKNIKVGQYDWATVYKVEEEAKLSQVQVSVDSKENVEEALKRNIPEINDGIIEIVNVVRQPGERTKVSFKLGKFAPENFDIFGAIIGPSGQRIMGLNKIIGEKIDAIIFESDPQKYIRNAMSPAKIIDVVAKNKFDANARQDSYWVIVAKDNLTPAIGRRGVNVSLASSLTGLNIDLITEDKAKEQKIEFTKMPDEQVKPLFKQRPPRTYSKPLFDIDKITVSADSFDSDVQNFQEHEFKDIDTSEFDLDFEELFKKHNSESKPKEENITIDDISKEFEKENDKKAAAKIDVEDYKKVKEAIEKFKVDDDLSSFGLDDFDISDFDVDEDWE
ncbi:transcription elongation protein NusA [Mycoplasmopsis bovigenitalium]|uniref:transcription termination/antitermination protein NusA n=1 Tax=Mycoplasmopsis bovigenitalium TaxID=2112 RepID=UPI0009097667|nr:transcription termination/antitermination protein NusA [Mycoplasmopsis bovigenitalium]BAW18229.1 transcription elongation protein NusA [Mycoplasmopsis bovigenitalium]